MTILIAIIGGLLLAALVIGTGAWLVWRDDAECRGEDEDVMKTLEDWRNGR